MFPLRITKETLKSLKLRGYVLPSVAMTLLYLIWYRVLPSAFVSLFLSGSRGPARGSHARHYGEAARGGAGSHFWIFGRSPRSL